MDQWITLRCTSSYPLIHSPYCYGVLPHQTKVTEQPAILPKCFWHTGSRLLRYVLMFRVSISGKLKVGQYHIAKCLNA